MNAGTILLILHDMWWLWLESLGRLDWSAPCGRRRDDK